MSNPQAGGPHFLGATLGIGLGWVGPVFDDRAVVHVEVGGGPLDLPYLLEGGGPDPPPSRSSKPG